MTNNSGQRNQWEEAMQRCLDEGTAPDAALRTAIATDPWAARRWEELVALDRGLRGRGNGALEQRVMAAVAKPAPAARPRHTPRRWALMGAGIAAAVAVVVAIIPPGTPIEAPGAAGGAPAPNGTARYAPSDDLAMGGGPAATLAVSGVIGDQVASLAATRDSISRTAVSLIKSPLRLLPEIPLAGQSDSPATPAIPG